MRLIRRRDALYDRLDQMIHCASVHQVEDILRRIHQINLKLKTYFERDHEPKEIFDTKDPVEEEDAFTAEESL